MFGAQWLILSSIVSLATAAAYRPRGTAPYANTTSPPYPLASSTLSPALKTSDSTLSASSVVASASSSAVSISSVRTSNSIPQSSAESSYVSQSTASTPLSIISSNTTQHLPPKTPSTPSSVLSTPSLATSNSSLQRSSSRVSSNPTSTFSTPLLNTFNSTQHLLSSTTHSIPFATYTPPPSTSNVPKHSTVSNSSTLLPTTSSYSSIARNSSRFASGSPPSVSTLLSESSHASQQPPYPVHGSGPISGGYGFPRPTGQQAPFPVNVSNSVAITSGYGRPTPTGSTRPSWSLNNPSNNNSSTAANASCTVNVPHAHIEWWYGATYYSPVGTFTELAPNWTSYEGQYLTMVPDTDSVAFDVASAITSDVAWSEVVTYDSEYDMVWTQYVEYTVRPAAATTSVVERDYIPALPSGNVFPATDVLTYLQPSSFEATVPIAIAANSTSAMTSAVPFLYFTAYEVITKTDGTIVTQTINLPQPTAIEYAIEGIENSASASGTLPAQFLRSIPQSACSPGSVQGSVTVLVVVDLVYVYLPLMNPFIIHVESTVLGWEDDPVVLAQGTSRGGPFVTSGLGFETTGPAGGAKATIPPNDPAPQSSPAPAPVSTPVAGESSGSKSEGGQPGSGQSGGGQFGGGQSGSEGSQPGEEQPSGGSSGGVQAGGNQPIQPLIVVIPPRETVGSIGTNPVVIGPSSVVVVGPSTLQAGAPAVTIGGNTISVAPSATAIVVDGRTSALPLMANPGSPLQTVGDVGGSPVAIGPSSVVVVGTQTLQPGGHAVLVNGSPVSLLPSGNAIVVGSKTANGAIVGTKTSVLPHVIFPTESAHAAAGVPPPILTIGSSTLTANAATQFFVAPGQTLTPGGTATVGGQLVSLGPSAAFVVVAGSTQVLPTSPPRATLQPEIVVGGSTITAIPGSNAPNLVVNGDEPSDPTFVVAGQTLSPGHHITVDGSTVSLASSGSFVVINGVTSAVANPGAARPPPPTLSIGNSIMTALPGSGSGTSFMIGSELLTAGGTVTVDGTVISLASAGSFIVVNGITSSFANAGPARPTPPPLMVGNSIVTALPGTGTLVSFMLGSQLLTAGGVVTVDGTTISLSPSGETVVIDGITSTFENAAARTTPPPLTIDGEIFSPLPGSGTSYNIDGQLLTAGGVITVDATTISLAPGATALIINGRTTQLTPQTRPIITNPPILTIGTHTYTAAPGTGTSFIIDGQTLALGGTITVNGTTIRLASGATQLVYGSAGRSTTSTLFPATTTRAPSLTASASAPASAGANGGSGEAAPTSPSEGAACSLRPSRYRFLPPVLTLFASVLLL